MAAFAPIACPHYPRSLARLILVRAPPHFWAAWRVARVFSPPWVESAFAVFSDCADGLSANHHARVYACMWLEHFVWRTWDGAWRGQL